MSSVSPLKDERPIIFPFQYALASLSLSLRFSSRSRWSKNEIFAGEKVGSRRNVTRATIN